MFNCVGIDPGIANVGLCLLSVDQNIEYDLDFLTTTKELEQTQRYWYIFCEVLAFIKKSKASFVVIESYYASPRYNKKTGKWGFDNNARDMHQSIGAIMAAVGSLGLAYSMCTPQQAKKALADDGNAVKDGVQRAAKDFLGLDKKPVNHVADAVALAYWGCVNYGGAQVLERLLPLWR